MTRMGMRDTVTDPDYPVEFEIEHLRWVDGDYSEDGTYWGRVDGDYIFRAVGESTGLEEMFVRAHTVEEVKEAVKERYPNATFTASADLSVFLAAYQEAALWSSTNDRYEDNPDEESEMLSESGYDLSEETLTSMKEDCQDFLNQNRGLLAEAEEKYSYGIDRAGHDFWLTRNGHGVGFWDRGLDDLGDKLSAAAKAFGEVDLYVGDDDLIYQTCAECPIQATALVGGKCAVGHILS